MCNTCYRYALVITPGLEKLEIEAVQSKIAEIAEILKPDLKHSMKIQMTPWKEAHKVRMEDLYTRLRIEKHSILPSKTQKDELIDYHELFQNLPTNKRILIKGNPGIGKTTFSRKIVYDWAHDKWNDTELESILLMFLVTLKYIGPDQSIGEMIKQQHKCLILNEAISSQILNEILKKCGEECLVILEGYDEIPEKFNKNLQAIVENEAYRNCHFVLTSRPNAVENLESYMSVIAGIEGFSKENTRKYIEKVIEDAAKWEAAYQYTENSAIEEMWRYPIMVLFLSLLVNWGEVDLNNEKVLVGEFYTRLLNCIYRRFVAEKIGKENQEEEEAKREETLLKIGKVAFKGILSNKVTYRKKEILKAVGPRAFQYGILIGTDEWEGRRDMPENADIFVYFVHKSIQEYLAAKYFMQQLQKGKSIEKLISLRNANLEFIKNNLMFFTFCGHFTNINNTGNSDSDLDTESDEDSDEGDANAIQNVEQIREHLVHFIAKCLDVKELKLERVAIFEESSWLFLEALPNCSHIKKLVLKDMKLKVSVSFLLSGIFNTLRHLSIENCEIITGEIVNEDKTFSKLETMAFSGEQDYIHELLNPAYKHIKTLDLKEYKLHDIDIEVIDKANSKGYLSSLKHLLIGNSEEKRKTNQSDLAGCVHILLSHPWMTLEELNLEECNLSKDDMLVIYETHKNGFLPSIDLTVKSFISSGHIPVVPVMCGAWRKQEVLDLTECKVSKQDVMTIAEANRHGLLPSLNEINLSYKKNTSGHVDSILSSKWESLQKLDLESCNLIVQDISAMGEANRKGCIPSLQILNLSSNEALSGQLILLFTNTWPVLQQLELRICTLTVEDIRALGEANRKGYLPSLQEVNLFYNKALSGQLTLLLTHTWSVLHKLDLQRCNLTGEDIIALGKANRKGYLPSLQEVDLAENEALSGQLTLLFTHTWPVLEELYLSDSNLTSADCDPLLDACRQGRLPQLKKLFIFGNSIPSVKITKLKEHIEDVVR